MANAKNVLNTSTANYLELIGNGKTYHVPPYQRDYAWQEEEWEDLWNDVVDLRRETSGHHYMGALVIQPNNDRDFTIIDGQQRLATIGTLALAVIQRLDNLARAGVDPDSNRERATELRKRFVGEKDPASLIESSRLHLNETDDGFYQDYLIRLRTPSNPKRLARSNSLLWKCFSYFSERLAELEDIQDDGEALARVLSESVARGLLFIVVTVDDELNAYTVFETLNARGLELTTADLLKNYLFSKVHVRSDLKTLERRWRGMLETVSPERFADFLRYHLLCEEPKIRKERLFKLVRDRVTTPEDVFDLVSALENRADLFAALSDANHEYWRERPGAKPHVRELILYRTRQITPVLFAAWERFNEDDFVRVIKLASVLSFRYLICARSTNALEPIYHEAAKAVLDGGATRPREVFDKLRRVYVDDGTFKSSFATFSANATGVRKRLVKYILCSLEGHVRSTHLDAETDPGTIEHVLPQNPHGEWIEAFTDQELESAIDRIGNVTLLRAATNREVGNAEYETKLEAYRASEYQLTKHLAQMAPETWTLSHIESRQQRLAEIAVNVWRSDFAV